VPIYNTIGSYSHRADQNSIAAHRFNENPSGVREIYLLRNNGGALSEIRANGPMVAAENCGEWLAAYTMPRREKRIAERCLRLGIDHFLPLYSLQRTWRNRVTVDIQLPLFPNYIFVRLLPGEYATVFKLPGVLSLVGNAAGPLPIPARDMDALRQLVRCQAFQPHAHIESGDMVRIQRGPLKGLSGVVMRSNNGVRFIVTLDLIGKSVVVDLNRADFEACSPHELSLVEARSVQA
jgi:transcription antitermination factor NusG